MLVPAYAMQDYSDEGIHYLPWPQNQPLEMLTLNFSNII